MPLKNRAGMFLMELALKYIAFVVLFMFWKLDDWGIRQHRQQQTMQSPMSVSAKASQYVDVNGCVPEKVQFLPLHDGIAAACRARRASRRRA